MHEARVQETLCLEQFIVSHLVALPAALFWDYWEILL